MNLPIVAATHPTSRSNFRVITSAVGEHLFVVDGSRLYDDSGPDHAAAAHNHPLSVMFDSFGQAIDEAEYG